MRDATDPLTVDLYLFAYGGVEPETVDSLLLEFATLDPGRVRMNYGRAIGDALISRMRSTVLTRFLQKSDADVCFMLDHDIAWTPGDVAATCEKAQATGGLVAGLYAKRAEGEGVASASRDLDGMQIGSEDLRPCVYAATGFLAIPRSAVETIMAALLRYSADDGVESDLCLRTSLWGVQNEPIIDFFRPVVVKSQIAKGHEYLSEDWAFSHRAMACGVPRFVYGRPQLRHYGRRAFTVATAFKERK